MSIKEKFEKGIYELEYIPRILEIEYGNLKINKYAPYPNEIESLEKLNFTDNLNLVDTQKLISPHSDSEFSVGIINKQHFESREKLDSLFIKGYDVAFSKKFDKISINKAFELLNVDVSCHMKYYLDHVEEIEKDLSRKVNVIELNETNNKKLEQELFYIIVELYKYNDEL